MANALLEGGMPRSGNPGEAPNGGDRPPLADGSGAMFDLIAERYDRLNRVLSLGIDQLWRRRTAAALELGAHARVLDLATGTADLALQTVRRHPDSHVLGLDPSEKMLAIGREKIRRARKTETVELRTGDAQELPFEDASFDGVTIAFGIRNVADRRRALREMARVTRPGGRVAILEATEPQGGLLAPLTRFYVHHVVPRLGALLSGAAQYRYLQSSIEAFPPPAQFAEMMESCNLDVLEVTGLTFGVCHLYVATPHASAHAASEVLAEGA